MSKMTKVALLNAKINAMTTEQMKTIAKMSEAQARQGDEDAEVLFFACLHRLETRMPEKAYVAFVEAF